MRDLYHNLAVVEALPPADYGADNTPAGIPLAGFESAMLTLQVGVGGITFTNTNKIEFVVTHSEDGVTYEAVTDDDMQGVTGIVNGIVLALKTAHAAATVHRFGYIGNRSHLKLLADFGGTHATATPLAATVAKGNARERPVAA